MISYAAQSVLRKMVTAEAAEDFEDAELVCEAGACWIGYWRTSPSVRNELLRLCLISDVGEQGKGVERYTINSDGRKAAEDRDYIPPELKAALQANAVNKSGSRNA